MSIENVKLAVHVDDKGKVLCQIRYHHQDLFIPIELIPPLSDKLKEWFLSLDTITSE